MRRWWHIAAVVALAAGMAAGGGAARAQDRPAGGDFDPKVKALIAQDEAAYRALSALHVKVSGIVEGSHALNADIPSAAELRCQRPNRLYLSTATKRANGLARRLIVCDGTTIWRWESATNTYTKARAPATLRGFEALPQDPPDISLLFSERGVFADLSDKSHITIEPSEKVNGEDMDVVAVNMAPNDPTFSLNIRLLFSKKDHLLHGMTANAGSKDEKTGKQDMTTLRFVYDLVDPTPHFTPADFTFTPPPGARLASPPKPAATQ